MQVGGEKWEKMARLDDEGTRSNIGSGGDKNESNEKEWVAISTEIKYRQQMGFEARIGKQRQMNEMIMTQGKIIM
jgi:hypothetical protein